MGTDGAKVAIALPDSCNVKVHRRMCAELSKFVDRILEIFPAIESAQPRCTTGIDALCSLSITMEKAKLLIQHCTECSKLYLVITGDAILMRCERIRNALEQSLSQIQNMVPLLLAAQISGIVDDLKDANFIMEPSEEKAGKVVLSLLRLTSDSAEASEFEAFQIAALSLHITSPKSLLIEKRSIKKLLDKVRNTDQKKERVLNYLLYLLSKYGKLIKDVQTQNTCVSEASCSSTSSAWNKAALDQSLEPESDVRCTQSKGRPDVSSKPILPEEFTCPISLRLMHDPVLIASGQTFERVWIQKWFSEGNDTCPKTQKQLSHFSVTPNSAIKDLISKWCGRHAISIPDPCSQPIPSALYSWKSSSSSSIDSLDNSLNDVPTKYDINNVPFVPSEASCVSDLSHSKVVDDLCFGMPQMNDDYHRCQSSADFVHVMKSGFSNLASLPWESQCNAVRDVKSYLEDNRQAYISMLSDDFAESLIIFLKDACDRKDVQAQRVGAQVLLTFVKRSRSEIPSLCEDVFHLMASFLDSEIAEEALAVMDILSADECCTPKHVASDFFSSILKILDSKVEEFHAPAVKILHNLSLYNNINSHILHMEFIQKLVSFLSDNSLAEYCLKVLKYICNTEEGRIAVVEADDCIVAIAELLETGTHKQQEHAVAVLLSLCSNHFENCQLVLKEGVIPPLVDISVNGDTKGRKTAMELLQLLRDIRHTDSLDSSPPSDGSIPKLPWDSSLHSSGKQSSPKASGFFGRKFKIFTKPSSLASF